MSKIADYSYLIQSMLGGTKSTWGTGSLLPGTFQLSQLNSSAVQKQLKAAGIDTSSNQYKAVIKQMMEGADGSMYTNIQAIKNLMKNYDKDGDFIDPVTGIAGMDATNIPLSEHHVLIDVDEENRQEMFENCKREFLQENGIANGDTTKRSEVFQNYQRSVKKADRLKGTWTLEQYERQYNQAFYAAARAADPSWQPGMKVPAGALDGITRESIDTSLVKTNGTYGETFTRGLDVQV